MPRYLRDDPNRIWPNERELEPLIAAARWAAWRVPIYGYDRHHLEYEALLRIVCDYNKIFASPHPDALARRIAVQHLLDVRRQETAHGPHYEPASGIPAPAGFGSDADSWEKQSVSARLEYFDGVSTCDDWWRARTTHGIFGRIRSEIAALDAKDRRTIELSFGCDPNVGVLEAEEVAQELGVAESTVYRRKGAALKKLRERLVDLKFRRT